MDMYDVLPFDDVEVGHEEHPRCQCEHCQHRPRCLTCGHFLDDLGECPNCELEYAVGFFTGILTGALG